MMTTNLIGTVKSETRLLVLASLRAQLQGVDAGNLHVALAKRLEDVFAQHLAAPIRDAVDSALTATIHATVDHSLVSTLDAALDGAVDAAIGSAVESLTMLPSDHDSTSDTVSEASEEPAVLTMSAAAQVASPASEDALATGAEHEFVRSPAHEQGPEPTVQEALPVEEVQPVAEDADEPDTAEVEHAGTGEISPEVGDAIRRLHAEGRSGRSPDPILLHDLAACG
jgi:hypothetical protein